jgi:hypothetical protein
MDEEKQKNLYTLHPASLWSPSLVDRTLSFFYPTGHASDTPPTPFACSYLTTGYYCMQDVVRWIHLLRG